MAWLQIGSARKFQVAKEGNDGASVASSRLYIAVEYDSASLTTTSVDIRFKGYPSKDGGASLSTTTTLTDRFYIVVNNTLLCLKGASSANKLSSGAWRTPAIRITKTSNATTFTIPSFYVSAIGTAYALPTTLEEFKSNYYTTWWQQHMGCVFSSISLANMPTAISVGAITGYTNDNITQVTIGASKHGQNNNSITSMTLRINGTTHTINWSGTRFTSSGSCNVTIPETAGKTYVLNIELDVVSTYEIVNKSKTITATHYFSPRASLPMEPPELMAPYKDKLVINGSRSTSCTWAWEKYTINPALEYDLAGYAIKLKFQPKELISGGESYQAYLYDSSGKQLSEDSDGIIYYLPLGAIDSENPSITFDPTKIEAESYSIKVGDRVQLGVAPYSIDNFNRPCPVTNNITWSNWIPVKRSAVTRVKTETGWQEGQVHVKTEAGWVEATAVLVKTETGWTEAI